MLPYYCLNNGVEIPKIGFGTWQLAPDTCYRAVLDAIDAGYRHIDTAYIYNNEEAVGKAIRDSGISRKDIFLVTKLPDYVKTYDGCMEYFQKSLDNLQVEYLDLFLIHAPWPWANQGQDCTEGNIEAWKAMVDLYREGKIRAIGVSNFHEKDIEPLIAATGVTPMVNQIRFFIGNTQEAITQYCQKKNILIEAYSPLATGEMLGRPELDAIAEKYQVSKAKICLRYCLERGTLPLPRSTNKERIVANLDLNFHIEKEDMDALNALYHIASTRKFRD